MEERREEEREDGGNGRYLLDVMDQWDVPE